MITAFAKWLAIVGTATRRHSVAQAAAVNFLIVGVTTVSGVLIARSLGAEGRGYYAAIMAWFAFAQVAGEFGQSGAVTYWVSRAPQIGKDYVASARVLMLVTGGLVSVSGILLSDVLANGNESVSIAYRIAFVGCLLNSFCAAIIYALQSDSLKRWNAVRISQPVIYLLLVAGFSFWDKLNIVSLSIVLSCSVAAQLLFAWVQGTLAGLSGGKPRRSLLQALTRYGLAHTGSAMPASLSTQYDRMLLSRVALPEQLGQYAVAYSMAGLAYPFSTAVASVVFPKTARQGLDERSRQRTEIRSILATAAVGLFISLVIGVAARPAIPLIFGEDFVDAAALVWWLIPAILFRSVSQVIGALLRGRRRPGLVAYGQLCGLALGGVAIFPLMAWIEMTGAALAVSLGELVVLVVAFVLLRREQRKAEKNENRLANAMVR